MKRERGEIYASENGERFFFFQKHKSERVSRDESEIIFKNLAYSYKALLLLACSKNNLAFKTFN